MADNYLQPVNNYFEDVDDDIFLNGGPTRKNTSNNPFEKPELQTYAEKRREIESRTLSSTEKSLGLLYETEEVGKATAVELAKQREQLERTSRQLDEINSTLRFSQRHLNGLKSVFGGLKNYLTGNNTQSPRLPSPSLSTQQDTNTTSSNTTINTIKPVSPTERYDSHPINRIRNDSGNFKEHSQLSRSNNAFETTLTANLDEMCNNLSRLKYLATDMGNEIESQNDLLDEMNYKTEDAGLKISKQNNDMNKLLGKK